MKKNKPTDPTLKQFLISLPLYQDGLGPSVWVFTTRASDFEEALEFADGLVSDEEHLIEVSTIDLDGADSLDAAGIFLGEPSVVEVRGEVLGVEEIRP